MLTPPLLNMHAWLLPKEAEYICVDAWSGTRYFYSFPRNMISPFFIFLRQRLDSFFFLIFVFFSRCFFFFFLLFVKWYIICSEVLLLWLPCNVPGIPNSLLLAVVLSPPDIYTYSLLSWYPLLVPQQIYVWLLFIIYVYSTPSAVRGNEHHRSPQTVRCSCYLLTIDIIITIMFTFVLVYLIHCVSFLLLSLALPWNRR